MWTASVAAWNMIVFARPMERATHVVRRRGWWAMVSDEGGPRMEQTGREDCSQIQTKSPKPIAAVVRLLLFFDQLVVGLQECRVVGVVYKRGVAFVCTGPDGLCEAARSDRR